MSILNPTEADLTQWASVIEKTLPPTDLGARLALANLLAAVVQKEMALTIVTKELVDLRAARPFALLQGGVK